MKANKKKEQMDIRYHKILQFCNDSEICHFKEEGFLFLLGFEESWRLSSSAPSC